MSKKIYIKDLSDIIASKAVIDNQEAEQLITTLFEVLAETALEGEQIKVKDFGTFKVTRIKARESVDVNTGEKIEIPAHDRVGFNPATALRELVNKPFAHFESVLLNEGISLEGIAQFEEDDDDDERLEESVAEAHKSKIVETLETAVELMQDDPVESDEAEVVDLVEGAVSEEEQKEEVEPTVDPIDTTGLEKVVQIAEEAVLEKAAEITEESETIEMQDELTDETKGNKKSFKAYLKKYPILIPIISGVAMAFASLLLHISGKDNSKKE